MASRASNSGKWRGGAAASQRSTSMDSTDDEGTLGWSAEKLAYKEVVSYFASLRLPAAILAALCVGAIYGLQFRQDDRRERQDEQGRGGLQPLLESFSLIGLGACLFLSLQVVLVSTLALTRALMLATTVAAADSNHYARSGGGTTGGFQQVLFNEFHLEYLSAQWCFIMSLLGFVVAPMAHLLSEYALFGGRGPGGQEENDQQLQGWSSRAMGMAVICMTVSVVLHLVSHVNSTLVVAGSNNNKSSLLDLTVDLAAALAQRIAKGFPLQIGSVVAFVLSLVFLVLGVVAKGRQQQQWQYENNNGG